jgi:glycosyltransferase involved in cell wall biosynthesis
MLALTEDEALRSRLGEEARAYAREWSDDSLAQRLLALYREMAGLTSPYEEILRNQVRRLGVDPR